jgi:hypothetical protein
MTGKTIGQLTAATSLDLTEEIEIEQGGLSKKAPLSLMVASLNTIEVGGDYTLGVNDSNIIVTTTAACILTLPLDLPAGKKISITRTATATSAITVARSGSETIEGGESFVTHGAFAASTLNDAEVVLEKKTATSWKFVGGIVAGSGSGVVWEKYADGRQHEIVTISISSVVRTAVSGALYRAAEQSSVSWPLAFVILISSRIWIQTGSHAAWISSGEATAPSETVTGSYFIIGTSSVTMTGVSIKVEGWGLWK